MKTIVKKIALLATFLFAASTLISCENTTLSQEDMDQNANDVSFNKNYTPQFTTTVADITDADSEALLFMYNEERLAHDVYIYAYEKYNLDVFDRISRSESRHTQAIKNLLNHFEIAYTDNSVVGDYQNQKLSDLYQQLIAQVDISANEAFLAGGLIEETDLLDLQAYTAATSNEDIKRVFANLERGSRNHLRHFYDELQTEGVVYSPQIMETAAFDAIVNTEAECGKGQGNGQHNCQGCQGNGQGQQNGQGCQGNKQGQQNGQGCQGNKQGQQNGQGNGQGRGGNCPNK